MNPSETYPIDTSANRVLFITLVLLHVFVLAALPVLLTRTPLWALVLLPMAWLNIMHWGLIHEAIHKLLSPSPRRNELGGRLLAVLMGPSFQVLRFGHLMHHQLNRHWHSERVEHPTLSARIDYYFNLLFGLYLSELTTGWLLCFLPRRRFMALARATFLKQYEQVAVAGERFFYVRGNIRAMRFDVLANLALYSAAFYFYGAQWPWLLTFIGARGVVISFMDNIYHYATPADNSKAGKELALPAAVSLALLHGNYHETHHTNPDVPWIALPQVHTAQARVFDGGLLDHGIMQFAGPVV